MFFFEGLGASQGELAVESCFPGSYIMFQTTRSLGNYWFFISVGLTERNMFIFDHIINNQARPSRSLTSQFSDRFEVLINLVIGFKIVSCTLERGISTGFKVITFLAQTEFCYIFHTWSLLLISNFFSESSCYTWNNVTMDFICKMFFQWLQV